MKQFRLIAAVFLFLAFVPALTSNAQAPQAPVTSQDILKTVIAAKGKVVVINFWASWCPPCRQEIPELIELRKRIPADKMLLIGVSLDQEPSLYAAFTSRAGFNYPVMRAADDVTPAFALRAIPRTIVYSAKGAVIHSQEGYMPGDELEALVRKNMGS